MSCNSSYGFPLRYQCSECKTRFYGGDDAGWEIACDGVKQKGIWCRKCIQKGVSFTVTVNEESNEQGP